MNYTTDVGDFWRSQSKEEWVEHHADLEKILAIPSNGKKELLN